jgi:hypothetical protein
MVSLICAGEREIPRSFRVVKYQCMNYFFRWKIGRELASQLRSITVLLSEVVQGPRGELAITPKQDQCGLVASAPGLASAPKDDFFLSLP